LKPVRTKDIEMRLFSAAVIGVFLTAFFPSPNFAAADRPLVYRLRYDVTTPDVVHVSIHFATPIGAPLILIMPRSVPGGYAQRPYDPFVANVRGFPTAGAPVKVSREDLGPRWAIGRQGEQVSRVEYDVDVGRMEREIFAASDTSKIREGYAGLLGYSIFAFIEGQENRPIDLEVSPPMKWSFFSTLEPSLQGWTAETSLVTEGFKTGAAHAADYYALADSQIMMGPKLQVREIDGRVRLFVVAYSEGEEDLTLDGALACEALDKVIAYFGKSPFSSYTVVLEFLRPVSPRHEYNFSMEHLNSGTFYLDVDHALTAKSTDFQKETHRFNYAHHIAHSWIPKRAYGPGYFPFNWEMTPVIDTIWFNEGFGRYVAIAALADALPKDEATRYRKEKLDRLRGIVSNAPEFLQRMRLDEVSREGSFLYTDDFRVGMNLFARGALMAGEMDDRIRSLTNGQKSLRDALRHLMDWSEQNHRAFRTDELPLIFRETTGVDTTNILDRWMQAPAQLSVR
jgi:predicted metalloprotease with PDZ domain